MALAIDTFSNVTGGFSFFKAVGHPLTARRIPDLLAGLMDPVAIYDPLGLTTPFAEIHSCSGLDLAGVFVQDVERIGETVLGVTTRPVTELADSGARVVFIPAFDAERLADHIRHLLPKDAEIVTLDSVRLDDDMLSAPKLYLDPVNFATNFAFFRDEDGHHTRIVTANYWAGYGAKAFGCGAACSALTGPFWRSGARTCLWVWAPLYSTVRKCARDLVSATLRANCSSMR